MARLKTLLFLLGLSLGYGSFSDASKNVALNSMLETIQEQVASKTQVTPEVAKGFKDMSKMVDDEIVVAIKEDFDATQAKLTALKDELVADSEAAQSQKPPADEIHKAVWECFKQENISQCAWEDAKELCANTHCAEAELDCAKVEPIFPWSIDDSHFNKKSCSLAHAKSWEDCAPLFALAKQTEHKGEKIEEDYEKYLKLKAACDDATDRCNKCKKAVDDQETALLAHKDKCADMMDHAKERMCKFGILLQEKCVALAEYDKWVSKTQEVKSEHSWSEEDRKNEYHAAKKLQCWLDSYNAQTALFDEAVGQPCIKSINYIEGMGGKALDVHEDVAKEHRSIEQQTCLDTHTVFHDKEWVLTGTGVAATCSDYESVPAKYALSYENHPYAFCGVSASDV